MAEIFAIARYYLAVLRYAERWEFGTIYQQATIPGASNGTPGELELLL
jgi:hypothetical protein